MLCDELKSLWVYSRDIDENCDEEFVNFAKENGYEELVAKSDVDAAIAELKQKLEDAGMRERKLRRELWNARAERAKDKQLFFHFSTGYPKLRVDGFYDPYSGRKELSPKKWIKVFNKVENKCRAKAEEYK